MKSKTKKAIDKVRTHPDYTIEERVCRLRRRLATMQMLFNGHNSLGETNAEDVLAAIDELTEDCLTEVDEIAKAPGSVMGWSPEQGGAR